MAADPDRLGIFVTAPQHMGHVMGVVNAALKAGKKVKIFFTYKATHLTKHPDFLRLSKSLTKSQMSSQEYHAEMIRECGKYLSL